MNSEYSKTTKKIIWPTMYLGLSRLYPVGESDEVSKLSFTSKLDENDIEFIIRNEKSIFSIYDEVENFTAIKISETNKKKSIGINTGTYDYLANSAGQDNLGQIIIAVLSFKKLKEELGENWTGGILLIDEIDSTLHPVAQMRLVDFLYKQAKSIGMQIVFTTHSISLLEYITTKTAYNNEDINNYELIYITNGNEKIEIMNNPQFETIYYDLTATYEDAIKDKRKISLFSEDNESRLFIRKILEKFLRCLNILDVSFGYENLLGMIKSDYNNFSKYLFILDGDVQDKKIEKLCEDLSVEKVNCLLKLPGNKRPEELIWDYINLMDSDHPFLIGNKNRGYTIRNFKDNGPFTNKYKGFSEDREKYKKWFNDNVNLINELMVYWIKDNKEIVDKFIDEFISAYNNAARLHFLPKIPKAAEGD